MFEIPMTNGFHKHLKLEVLFLQKKRKRKKKENIIRSVMILLHSFNTVASSALLLMWCQSPEADS
jgi:hypothetical protein